MERPLVDLCLVDLGSADPSVLSDIKKDQDRGNSSGLRLPVAIRADDFLQSAKGGRDLRENRLKPHTDIKLYPFKPTVTAACERYCWAVRRETSCAR